MYICMCVVVAIERASAAERLCVWRRWSVAVSLSAVVVVPQRGAVDVG